MNPCSFEVGTELELRGERFVVDCSGPRGVRLLPKGPKAPRFVSGTEVQAAFASGELKLLDLFSCVGSEEGAIPAPIPKGLSQYSPAVRHAAARRKKYLEALCPTGRMRVPRSLVSAALREAWRNMPSADREAVPPSVATFYQWRRDWIKSSFSDAALVPRVDKRGRRPAEVPAELKKVLVQVVNDEYATATRPTIAECHRSAVQKVKVQNRLRPDSDAIPIPTVVQMRRAIETFDPYRLLERRYGKAAADAQTRVFGAGPGAVRLLERVEVDHTRLDVICVSSEAKLPLGRPWMTTLIDVASRMIVGLWISFHTPNANSVLRVLKQAIRRKEEVLADFGLSGEWPCYGVPQALILDNGKEFHSKALDAAAEDLSMHLIYCPKETPHFKGVVERFFGTVNTGLVHMLPGTTFSNPRERGDYDAEACAVLTVDEVRRLIFKWVVEVYATQFHRALGAAPLQRWHELAAVCPPQMPNRPEVLDVYLRPMDERSLTSKGIEINSLFYVCRELEDLRLRNALRSRDLKMQIRANPDDLGAIEVLHPETDTYFVARCTRPDYADGMTLEQHKFHKANALRKYAQLEYYSALLASKEEIREMVKQAVRRAERSAALQAAADKAGAADAKVVGSGQVSVAPKTRRSRRDKPKSWFDKQAKQFVEQGTSDATGADRDSGECATPDAGCEGTNGFTSFDDIDAFGPRDLDLFS